MYILMTHSLLHIVWHVCQSLTFSFVHCSFLGGRSALNQGWENGRCFQFEHRRRNKVYHTTGNLKALATWKSQTVSHLYNRLEISIYNKQTCL